ncbi:hypothetical protein K8I28_17650 [bacterium]|nr:hypothetical protein [bacterium]
MNQRSNNLSPTTPAIVFQTRRKASRYLSGGIFVRMDCGLGWILAILEVTFAFKRNYISQSLDY